MKRTSVVVAIIASALFCSPLYAQTFSSGSTGADGALDISSWPADSYTLTLPLPPSGIFNFTTVDVPGNRSLQFVLNAQNTPVVILAQGNVRIAGTISVSGRYEAPNFIRTPGPGGFFGGFAGGTGFGPGGGEPTLNNGAARWVGPLTLVPIVGGSGGAGINGCTGAGGGGAILIASSSSIVFSGWMEARPTIVYGCSPNGSGGAIRLVANAVSASGYLNAEGYASNDGVVRIEAPSGALSFTGSSQPAAVLATINPALIPTSAPTLSLVTLGGFPVPSGAGTRSDTVDLLLPTQLADPIPLVVHGSNIPVGSQVTLSINGSPSATAAPATLTGTDASSTATLNISGLDRTKTIFLFASVTFDVPNLAQAVNPAGPDHVAKVRVVATPGQESRVAFLRQDGSEIGPNQISPEIRQAFAR